MAVFIRPTRQRNLLKEAQSIDLTLGDYASLGFEQGLHFSPTSSLNRMMELTQAELGDSPILSPKEATERFGIESHLSFSEPVKLRVAEIKHERKQRELERNRLLATANGFLENSVAIGTDIFAAILDPIGVAASFIPIVGQARYARMVARVGKTGARLRKGAIEGAVGAAMVEPLILGAAIQEEANYDAFDSLINVTFGTALGGGLHVVGGKVADFFSHTSPEAHEAAVKTAVNQMANGQAVEVEPIIRTKETVEVNDFDPTKTKVSKSPELTAAEIEYHETLKSFREGKAKPESVFKTKKTVDVVDSPYKRWVSQENDGEIDPLIIVRKIHEHSDPKITDSEFMALNRYQSYSTDLNMALREGRDNAVKDQAEWVADLDSATQKWEAPEDGVTFRKWIPVEAFDTMVTKPYGFADELNDLIGKTYSDKGFLSTTAKNPIESVNAGSTENAVILQLHYRKGQKMAVPMEVTHSFPSEKELLFPRNTQFRIVAAYNPTEGNVSPVLIAEIIPDAPEAISAKTGLDMAAKYQEHLSSAADPQPIKGELAYTLRDAFNLESTDDIMGQVEKELADLEEEVKLGEFDDLMEIEEIKNFLDEGESLEEINKAFNDAKKLAEAEKTGMLASWKCVLRNS